MPVLAIALALKSIPSVLGAAGASISDVVLEWISGPEDNTPLMGWTFDAIAEDDVLTLQFDDNTGFTSPTEFTHIVTAGEILDSEFEFLITPLPDGLTYARGKRNSGLWSNTENETILAPSIAAMFLLMSRR